MPFLPMKYPEYRLSMEATLPSSVHCWLMQELELRGIDSLVYTRYIISLLLQDGEDLDGLEGDLDSFPTCKRKGRRSGKGKQLSASDEERKKLEAIQCLSAVTDEKSGIETLVEELCSRLKDSELEASLKRGSKSRSCSSDGSDESGTENQNPAQRYYAAFPALHGQGVSTKTSPSETIWRNNPLVKSHASLMSEEDSSSANEDAEIRKINIPVPIAVPKQRRPRKSSNSRTRRDNTTGIKRENSKSRGLVGQKGGKPGQKGPLEKRDVPWPPGFVKLDPILLSSLDTWPESYTPPKKQVPKRPNNELCNKVESLLKGMLLPTPEKTYKDLQDVEDIKPEEFRQKIEKKSVTAVTSPSENSTSTKGNDCCKETDEGTPCSYFSDVMLLSPRGESVSPELQEQEIWYTQPIDVIFQSQDDEVSNSKLRLYKRSSDPSFSPDPDSFSEPSEGGLPSPLSSPVEYARRSTSFALENSDEILEGSFLIPSWLTDVLSGDESNMDDASKRTGQQKHSLKSSSPDSEFQNHQAVAALKLQDSEDHLLYEGENSRQIYHHDDYNTPTPASENNSMLVELPLSVSLVDLDYMSRFLVGDQGWHSYSPEDGFTLQNSRRTCITTLWQSQVLFDFSLNISDTYESFEDPVLEFCDIQCWHPLGTRPYSQLWDVNMQKRSKMSIWGGQNFCPENQVWFAENTLIFLNSRMENETDKHRMQQSGNTLIPRISIDIIAEDASTFPVEEEIVKTENISLNYFDRSVSLGDVPSLWEDEHTKIPDPKLSKSFELVPSEHSAFKDVPRKLVHVHSEPNLVQFRQEFGEGEQANASSPHEHLYYSPKTHFRPITPAYVPEVMSCRSKQQVCHDLFGGLPNTKTPYQQYQVADKDSDSEGFVPSFKVKNASKSIQTGESFEKVDSPEGSNETLERDTPETLTLSIIEDVIEEKVDQLITITEDLDCANTDSAYETDYGGNQGVDLEYDLHHRCCQGASFEGDIGLFVIPNVDHGNLGEIPNFPVESFEATYPHTNDWPEVPPNGFHWADNEIENHIEKLPTTEYLDGEKDDMVHVSSYVGHATKGISSDDLGLEHLYKESEMEKYRNIWSSGSNNYFSFEAGLKSSSAVGENYGYVDEEYDNVPNLDYLCNFAPDSCEGKDFFEYHPVGEVLETCMEPFVKPPVDLELPFPTYAEFPEQEDFVLQQEGKATPKMDQRDYFSVKLVYRNKKLADGDPQGYGDCDLVPMPEEAVMSTVLEEQWRDPKIRAMWSSAKPSSLQRKPCSFYLEGNCRRADCKFAHDISNITCRFWEEGGCFKGPLCPFLHGYPRVTSPGTETESPKAEIDKYKFALSKEEFPELSQALENSRIGNCGPKKHKSLKPLKSDTAAAVRREKGRKGNKRRHSNKENMCEIRVENKCSSSI